MKKMSAMKSLLAAVILVAIPASAQKPSTHPVYRHSSKSLYSAPGGSVPTKHHAITGAVPANPSRKELVGLEKTEAVSAKHRGSTPPTARKVEKKAPDGRSDAVNATYQKPKGGRTAGNASTSNKVQDRKVPIH